MSKIFLTGATGYIGGEALYAISKKHPDFSISALVRDTTKNQRIKAAFSNVRIVNGELDDFELLKREAANADIVVHTADASDHVIAAQAIAAGLAEGHTASKPGYWLHVGGTGILTFRDSDRNVYGEYDDKIYNDWEGVDELTHLPDHAFHRNVDKIVLEAGTKNADRVKTALICPPTIYGPGRGPINQKSRQVYALASMTLQIKKAPLLGAGKSIWNNVHIQDLGQLFVLLTEAAVAGRQDKGLWGAEGYYFVENGEHVWGDVSRSIAQIAAKEGYIPEPSVGEVDIETCEKFAGYQAMSWGMNSRGKAKRAVKLLDWKPVAPSLEEELPGIVNMEYNDLKK
ncbi:nucleoside-diphosphate-sugar epimerase, putative [Talaromyces stipitatus ATCC 10500]|uniref:Nucleoside-diphosphate-sugar epimerase, putative n=1 Tax=Talaromyces stipitatus (strain ATCC 10500 / CBS 375.48 / QM 6759 / NRRL 1006) TaxID=441959 RepID=B8M7S7_TALSN|nr:nucleoside-diphosphate-sugar epimerase, putative [Talaromyces stipitatus ATCC 10500]EED19806.1 nucleoside-diphosphate-sugar epimerase, putative [Talaromyces stipitatus ATCC 10500]